jgi:hypothetical protein
MAWFAFLTTFLLSKVGLCAWNHCFQVPVWHVRLWFHHLAPFALLALVIASDYYILIVILWYFSCMSWMSDITMLSFCCWFSGNIPSYKGECYSCVVGACQCITMVARWWPHHGVLIIALSLTCMSILSRWSPCRGTVATVLADGPYIRHYDTSR